MTITAPFLMRMADKISPFIADLGADVMRIYHGNFTVQKKSDNSPFTIADTLTEHKILAFLRRHTPHIPIYAEESFTHFPAHIPDCFWLVDPIDGTKGFIRRNNTFTINIGLIYKQHPVFGVVYNPQKNDTFVGFALHNNTIKSPDKTTTYNIPETIKSHFEKDISTNLSTDLSTSLSPSLWASYKNNVRIRCTPIRSPLTVASNANMQMHPIKGFLQPHHIHRVIAHTSSIKICMVATGEADMYPRWGRCYEWDTAAGDAILRGAGGTLCDMQGTPLLYGKSHLLNTAFLCLGKT